MSKDEDALIEGALSGTGYDTTYGMPTSGYEGPSFDQTTFSSTVRMIDATTKQLKPWVRAGAPFDAEQFSQAMEAARAKTIRQQAMAADILANRDVYVQAAVRADKIGKAYPWLPADVAFALSMAGHDDQSPVTNTAATQTAVTGGTPAVTSIGAVPERKQILTATAAVDFARVNAEMSDAELFAKLSQRGWDPTKVVGFTLAEDGFHTESDSTVTVGVREVLESQAQIAPGEDNGSWLTDSFGFVYDKVKATSRTAFAFTTAPWEAFNGAIRENLSEAGDISNADKLKAIAGAWWGQGWAESWDETTFAEAMRQHTDGGANQGTGWFMGGTVSATKTARDYFWYANQIGEEPATLGRASMSLVFDAGSEPFRLASGLVDGVGALALDPSSYVPVGALGKTVRTVPGLKSMSSAYHVADWSKGAKIVSTIDTTSRTLDDVIQGEKLVAPPVPEVGFPASAEVSRLGEQATPLTQWAPRWYSGGSPSQTGVRAILLGGTKDARSAGVRIRSRRKIDSGTEPIRMEFDAEGVVGSVDTTPSTNWASEIDRNYSTNVIPHDTLGGLKDRLTRIDVSEEIDPSHPVSDALNSLVADRGWNVVRRKGTTSYYRPDQVLPAGDRVTPFVDHVDTTTGEMGQALVPGADSLDNALANWTDAVTMDQSIDTFTNNFGEIKPLRTEQYYTNDPLVGVTDATMLNEIPEPGMFRTMYSTDQLKGGVDTEAGAHQVVQTSYADAPDAAWGKPKAPAPFDEAKATKEAERQHAAYLRQERPNLVAQAKDEITNMEHTVSDRLPFSFSELSPKAQREAMATGDVPLEDILNAAGPDQAENLARLLTHGLRPDDGGMGVRAESMLSANDAMFYDTIRQAVGDPVRAEKIIADWTAGKPVKIRTRAEMKALAQPESKLVGRVVDDAGNVVNPGRRVVVRSKRVGGGGKVTVNIPSYAIMGDLEQTLMHQAGDVEDIVASARAHHAAAQSAYDSIPDAPNLYVGEQAAAHLRPGQAEAHYPDFRLFPTARTAVGDSGVYNSMKGVRAAAVKFYKGHIPKVADIADPEVARTIRNAVQAEFNKALDVLGSSGRQMTQEIIDSADRLERALATAGDPEQILREYERFAMMLPESQGQNAARAAMHMEGVSDALRSQGYGVLKWQREGKDIYEILDTSKVRYDKVSRVKVSEKATLVRDSWTPRRFGVKITGKQDQLYDHLVAIDAPRVRPPDMEAAKWTRWAEQRQRMLDRGWSAEPTETGREVLKRPLAGEYDGEAGAKVNALLSEGDVTPSNYADAGINLNGTRNGVDVPAKLYDWITNPEQAKLWDALAATDSIDSVIKAIGFQNPALMAKIVRATEGEHIKDLIIEALGMRQLHQIRVRGGGRVKMAGLVNDALYHTPGFRRSLDEVRMLHVMPGQYVNLNEPEEAFKQLHNWLITAKVPKADRDPLLLQMAENMTAGGRKETFTAAFDAIETTIAVALRKQLRFHNMPEDEAAAIARDMTTLFKKEHNLHRNFHVREPGERGHVAGTQLTQQDFVTQGPMVLGDFLDTTLTLPNPREITRVTGIVGRVAATGTLRGKGLEKLMGAADAYNTFWKVSALARLAYPVRVMMEEQGRMYAAGLPNIYSHPVQYILHTYVGHQGTDLMGRKWIDLAADPEPKQFAAAQVNAKLLFENDSSVKFIGSNYVMVGPEDEQYMLGWMYGLGKMHTDPLARRLVGKWTNDELASMPQHIADANPVDQVTWWLMNDDALGKQYLASMLETTRTSMPDFNASLRRVEGVGRWVQEIEDQVRYVTGQYDPALVDLIKTGTLKAGDHSAPLFVSPDTTRGAQVWNTTHPNRGGFIDVLKNFERIESKPLKVIAPDSVISRGELKWYDTAVTTMFSYLNGRPTNYLSRSPAFRYRYADTYAQHARYASDEAAEQILKNLDGSGILSGQRKAIEKALKNREGTSKSLRASDIDALAKDDALEYVRELLYDTADKTHFWDAMRIVAPFGNAWAEVFSTWARLSVANPKVLDRLGHAIHGAQQTGSNIIYDATNQLHDGDQGFFFKDAKSGDEAFAWPMPPQVQGLVAAVFPAPVAGLNMIGQVQPGFGPVVTTMAAPLQGKPGWAEDVYNFIAPFGGPSAEDAGGLGNAIIDSVTPAWVRKLMTAVYPINAEQKSQLQAATLSSQIYLSSTGKYDMSSDSDIDRLKSDAETMARRLFFLRGIGQFFLPTMGSPEQVAKTGNGELVLQAKLAQILQNYQADPGRGGYGYQQGYLRFLSDYGSELYLMGASQTESSGFMAPTRRTYDFMREHPGLARKYDQVWGLLVDDPGSEFYYPAYQAQIRSGFRTLINPADLVSLANDRIGRALYTSYRAQYPDSLSESQSAELQKLQGDLESKYPGYNRLPTNIGESSSQIQELYRASQDSEVKELPIGQSLGIYFAARDQFRAQGISDFRTGDGRVVAPQLYGLGERLAASDPTFATAWDRLLKSEFDSEQFVTQEVAS